MDNLRINIDSFHKAGEPENPLFLASNFSEDFLGTDSNRYQVTVEKAEFPIANMDIFLNTKDDLWITFEDGRKSDREVKVIKGGFKNIQQFIDAVNLVLDSYETDFNYGKFTFDTETELALKNTLAAAKNEQIDEAIVIDPHFHIHPGSDRLCGTDYYPHPGRRSATTGTCAVTNCRTARSSCSYSCSRGYV